VDGGGWCGGLIGTQVANHHGMCHPAIAWGGWWVVMVVGSEWGAVAVMSLVGACWMVSRGCGWVVGDDGWWGWVISGELVIRG
jgi:hypothetical protein